MIAVTPSSEIFRSFSNPDPDMRLLVANRGEIARRVIRAASEWGVPTVAIYADPDAEAPFVREATTAERIGPASLAESYLSIGNILGAAVRSGATHIHPGYGFMAERADFAQAVIDAGLTWVGPSPDAIAAMGSKINARSLAVEADVPVIPGYNESQDADNLARAAESIGYPVLIKASAGGGGKGIRIAATEAHFADALSDARQEAERSFGDGAVIVERYVTRPRHIEVQIAGDRHGTVLDFGTRECSVQRRYQKVLEEAPAPNLPDGTRAGVRTAAVALAAAIGYDSVGTVEFIVDSETNEFFFLEMNTRIQVEHTVTEEVWRVDLIQLQLILACGEPMPLSAADVGPPNGHAFEARINAEDPWNDHSPQTGTVDTLEVADAPYVRWDAAVEEGSEISPFYDSMIGKLIVSGADRLEALVRLQDALDELRVGGVITNVDFHRWLVRQPEVRRGDVSTTFLDEAPLPRRSPFTDDAGMSPWSSRIGERFVPHRSPFAFDARSRDERWYDKDRESEHATEVRAPFPGLITEINVLPGNVVSAGQALMTIEAMKMLHPIVATGSGTVANLHAAVGSQVASNDLLITFDIPPGDPPATPTSTGDQE